MSRPLSKTAKARMKKESDERYRLRQIEKIEELAKDEFVADSGSFKARQIHRLNQKMAKPWNATLLEAKMGAECYTQGVKAAKRPKTRDRTPIVPQDRPVGKMPPSVSVQFNR